MELYAINWWNGDKYYGSPVVIAVFETMELAIKHVHSIGFSPIEKKRDAFTYEKYSERIEILTIELNKQFYDTNEVE